MNKKVWFQQLWDFLQKTVHSSVLSNSSAMASRARRKLYGTQCFIDTNVFITNQQNFIAQESSALYHGTYILNTNGIFSIGKDSHLGAFCYVNAANGSVTIGDDVAIGPGTKIISYSNHYSKGKKVSDERVTSPIVIGNNVFIGANCSILPGTVIKDNVVVGAGTVVKGVLEENAIYAGVPCKAIRNGWYS